MLQKAGITTYEYIKQQEGKALASKIKKEKTEQQKAKEAQESAVHFDLVEQKKAEKPQLVSEAVEE